MCSLGGAEGGAAGALRGIALWAAAAFLADLRLRCCVAGVKTSRSRALRLGSDRHGQLVEVAANRRFVSSSVASSSCPSNVLDKGMTSNTTLTFWSCLRPRIGRSRDFSRPWSPSTALLHLARRCRRQVAKWPLSVQTAARSAQRDQSWASPMAFRSSGRGRRFERTHQTQTVLSGSSPTAPKPSDAFRLAEHLGSVNVAAELGTIWSSTRPGRSRLETLGLSLAPPELDQLAGLTVARFSANLRRCSAGGPRPNRGVLEGTFALCRPAQRGLCWRPIVAVVGQQERGRPMGFRIRAILTGASRWGLTMARAEPATRPEELRAAGGAAGHRPVGV